MLLAKDLWASTSQPLLEISPIIKAGQGVIIRHVLDGTESLQVLQRRRHLVPNDGEKLQVLGVEGTGLITVE